MAEQLRILSIGAHPADVFDQSGGAMAHHAARGDKVSCIVITHGARTHDQVISEQMFKSKDVPQGDRLVKLMEERAKIKQGEVRKACNILGFDDIHFLGVDDEVLLVTPETVRRVARLIRKIKPHIILTHYPKVYDGIANQHAVTGQIVLHAIQTAAAVDTGDPTPPVRVAQVFFFGTSAGIRQDFWSAGGPHYCDVFIDTTDVVDKKKAALNCLESQGYAGAYTSKRIEASDGDYGICAGTAYAEGFITMNSETHYLFPITEMALKNAVSSDYELMARYSQFMDEKPKNP
ncbi:MAG: hypothetical protein FJ319_12250 [SAR202 cluster bacterium]|nr:hypothetical protein [SAR202 cluster bacterium]